MYVYCPLFGHFEYMPHGTDRRTDGRQTNAFSVTLTVGESQRIHQGVVVVSDVTCLKCVHSLETVHQRIGSS